MQANLRVLRAIIAVRARAGEFVLTASPARPARLSCALQKDLIYGKSMLTGSCLCGAVAYEVDAEPAPFVHCHCQTCRKTHGSAFSSVMPVPRAAFRWVRGDELLAAFESSPGKFRRFCTRCGSHIMAERIAQPNVLLRMGCLDTPVAGPARAHIWRSDAASWYDPKDATPELPEAAASPPPAR
ncbi:blr5558 [Bradyrhizobium diazoefficiens USDA 110]|uniref:Blr5558 protein n=2 Tax=Bradyrhizobium diazoefficiens TaxID=1355477 RepID=Q89IS6_BRADU|nr:hypothetical protein CO678_32780 [Bradyrhizobium diazoefficiens]QBP24333.1 GFA family protein [Bradyrhizobium diazoefficiens]BAC50823.1 blr5558 [Bradyrhizobium diazoefficiens USDA 110]